MYPKGKTWSPEQRQKFYKARIKSRMKKGLPIPTKWYDEAEGVDLKLSPKEISSFRSRLDGLKQAIATFERFFEDMKPAA